MTNRLVFELSALSKCCTLYKTNGNESVKNMADRHLCIIPQFSMNRVPYTAKCCAHKYNANVCQRYVNTNLYGKTRTQSRAVQPTISQTHIRTHSHTDMIHTCTLTLVQNQAVNFTLKCLHDHFLLWFAYTFPNPFTQVECDQLYCDVQRRVHTMSFICN